LDEKPSKLKKLANTPQSIIDSIQKRPKTYLVTFWAFVIIVFLIYNLLGRLTGFSILSDPPLGFYERTGFYCPACGGTRMTH